MIYIDQFVKISYENNIFKYSKMFNINLNKENIIMRIQKLNLYVKKKIKFQKY